MRRVVYALPFIFFAWAVCAQQILGFPPGAFDNRAALAPAGGGGGGYTGPGDIVSGALVWWGLRGYNASFSGAVVNICDHATHLVCADVTWSNSTFTLTIPTIGGSACNSVVCDAKIFYDQSGNGKNLTSQGSTWPTFNLNAIGSNPSMSCAAACEMRSSATLTTAQPFTTEIVDNTQTGLSSPITALGMDIGSDWGVGNDAPNRPAIRLSTNYTTGQEVSATDGNWYALVGLMNSGACAININGSDTTSAGCSGGASPDGNAISIFAGAGAFTKFNGGIVEAGVWAGGFTLTQRNNMTPNAKTYYGF